MWKGVGGSVISGVLVVAICGIVGWAFTLNRAEADLNGAIKEISEISSMVSEMKEEIHEIKTETKVLHNDVDWLKKNLK